MDPSAVKSIIGDMLGFGISQIKSQWSASNLLALLISPSNKTIFYNNAPYFKPIVGRGRSRNYFFAVCRSSTAGALSFHIKKHSASLLLDPLEEAKSHKLRRSRVFFFFTSSQWVRQQICVRFPFPQFLAIYCAHESLRPDIICTHTNLEDRFLGEAIISSTTPEKGYIAAILFP